MDIISELTAKMRSYSKIDDTRMITATVRCNDTPSLKFRDHLMEIGTILEHDEEAHIFIATINSGFGNKNPSIVGLALQDQTLYIAAYAKEGLLHQHAAQKVIQKVMMLFA